MRFSLWLPVLVCASSPLYAQSSISAYDQGVAARRAGDAARAVTFLDQAVRQQPASADAQVQLGYALLALARLDEADRAFSDALRLAPAYDDARVGQALIAERRGDLDRARALVATVGPDHVEGSALRRRLEAARITSSWQLDVDARATRVAGRASDWHQLDVQLSRRMGDGSLVSGRIETARRFGLTDAYGEARVERPVGKGSSIYLLAGATPSADFRPRWQAGAGARLRVHGGSGPTSLTLDVRHADYRSGAISLLNPGIEQYLAGGRAWITAQSINLIDGGKVSSGWLARIDVLAGTRVRLFGGAADAPDADQGVFIRTRSLFAGASLDLNESSGLRISLSRDRPNLGAKRTGISVGTTVRF